MMNKFDSDEMDADDGHKLGSPSGRTNSVASRTTGSATLNERLSLAKSSSS